MKNIVVLVSGQGSNLQALINACQLGQISAKIVAVFSNKAQAYGLQRAKAAGIAAHALDANAYQDRAAFDAALADVIDQYQPDLVVLAGYMRILSPPFVQRYAGRMLNIHPSLLPKYPGLHTHRQAIDNGDSKHGTSVHFVTEKLDGGPVILQAKVPIVPGDEEDDVIARIQAKEHTLYPLVANWFVTGRLVMRENAAWLDGEHLPAPGHAAD
ncbi:phosphoribosylglycinamide formyltransferase [Serratia symbiotica]|uniref:phosphoribosylglycinamide formyltransferase n=1 Tax=Serratia symbiotica TaxID=138074 RepID=UPI0030CEA6B8|nr:phosphoribosylglycinamide formyltransferase [Serratia symbiotica]